MAKNLYLSKLDHDLALTATGQLRMTSEFSEEVAQSLTTRLKMWAGEWWLNTDLGVPYVESILVKSPDLGTIRTILVDVITRTEGVASLISYEHTYTASARTYEVSFVVALTNGETLPLEVLL